LYLWGYTDPVISRSVIIYTSARVGEIGPWPKRKALTPFYQKWQVAIKRFSFLVVSAKDSQTLGDAKAIPIAGFSTVIIKHSFIPVSPTCNWGQGPVLEGILSFMRSWQSCFEGDPLRFGFDELKRVRVSHWPKEIGWWLVLNGNKNLGG
jgi:hypothetical protein